MGYGMWDVVTLEELFKPLIRVPMGYIDVLLSHSTIFFCTVSCDHFRFATPMLKEEPPQSLKPVWFFKWLHHAGSIRRTMVFSLISLCVTPPILCSSAYVLSRSLKQS